VAVEAELLKQVEPQDLVPEELEVMAQQIQLQDHQ
jgi:hypothetical protein